MIENVNVNSITSVADYLELHVLCEGPISKSVVKIEYAFGTRWPFKIRKSFRPNWNIFAIKSTLKHFIAKKTTNWQTINVKRKLPQTLLEAKTENNN